MKIRNKYLAIIFILTIALLGSYILFIKDKPEISQLEKRRLSNIEKATIKNWINRDFQNSIEDTMADHFVERNLWLKQYNKLEMSLNYISDKFISILFNKEKEQQISIQKVNDKVNLVTIDDEKYLIRPSYIYNEAVEKGIVDNINKINYLRKKYEDVNFYVYIPTMPHYSHLFDVESCGRLYLDLFDKLEVPHTRLEISTISDFQEMFFKTDHHWNHVGSYQGYVDIINLLFNGKEKPDTPIINKTFDNIEFYGSLSAQIAHSIDFGGDKLCKYIFQLPEYKLYINGEIVEEYGNYDKYVNGEIDKTPGFDHYNNLYQSRQSEIIFDTNRDNYDNILVISDSYSNPIRDVIASQFNKSIFINLDKYNSNIGKFNLDQYIEEYEINKVLFMKVLGSYFPDGELKYLDVTE